MEDNNTDPAVERQENGGNTRVPPTRRPRTRSQKISDLIIGGCVTGIFLVIAAQVGKAPTPIPTPSPTPSPIRGANFQIGFDAESLKRWHFASPADTSVVKFTPIHDNFVKDGVFITAPEDSHYALDFEVPNEARGGDVVTFVSKVKSEVQFYVGVELRNVRGERKEGWLQYGSDVVSPSPYRDTKGDTWTSFVEPRPLRGDWNTFKVYVPDAVKETFGTEGWTFSKLLRLRVRQNVYLASASITKK